MTLNTLTTDDLASALRDMMSLTDEIERGVDGLYYIVLKTAAASSWGDAPVCMDTLKRGFTRTLNALCGWNITTEE
jgi:hypothetical protein